MVCSGQSWNDEAISWNHGDKLRGKISGAVQNPPLSLQARPDISASLAAKPVFESTRPKRRAFTEKYPAPRRLKSCLALTKRPLGALRPLGVRHLPVKRNVVSQLVLAVAGEKKKLECGIAAPGPLSAAPAQQKSHLTCNRNCAGGVSGSFLLAYTLQLHILGLCFCSIVLHSIQTIDCMTSCRISQPPPRQKRSIPSK